MLPTTFLVIANCLLERTIKSVVITGTDLGSGLSEIQTAENDVDRCMVLVDKHGANKTFERPNNADIYHRKY